MCHQTFSTWSHIVIILHVCIKSITAVEPILLLNNDYTMMTCMLCLLTSFAPQHFQLTKVEHVMGTNINNKVKSVGETLVNFGLL